ncbi:MAG: 5-oxoprolinase subunit PxpB [Rhodanobacteraceae bacterium]|nr:MAG: 5-oxoprolinase subunit PxpB [Rhodanobacteraceae bacterium]
MTTGFAIEPLAEDTLLLRFGDGIDAATNARVHAAALALRDADLAGIVDIAPAYASLLVRFDPFAGNDNALLETITKALDPGLRRDDEQKRVTQGCMADRIVEIPACYGGDCGPDLDAIAEHARLPRDEVIARHTAVEYSVAMLGFAPGFPYLLGLDPTLQMPRRANPRTRVPAGSVAIGGAQTGIYTRELPGGWQLIGRTPLVVFDQARETPCLFAPGDRVRFRAIGADEFVQLAKRSA